MKYLMPVAVLLPIIFGAALPLFRFKKSWHRVCYVLSGVCVTSLAVLAMLLKRPEGPVTLVKLTGTLHITIWMDGLSGVFSGLVAFLWPLASLYAFEYIKHEGGDDRFFAFYTATYGVTLGIAMSANLITLYLFYELLTLVTLPLVTHTGDRRSVKAGMKYLTYSIGGAACAFAGMMILYVHGSSSLPFVYGGFVEGTNGHGTLMLIGYLLCFFGFGVKAALFPFHSWLPTAGVAPTPVTALLHAVAVVKAGAFAIMRVTFYCFGTSLLRGTWAQSVAMAFAAFTIVFGSSMALREQHLKRRLAYSTVSNLSYIVFGVTLMTPAGLTGALCHMVFHGIMKITLFFCAGAIMYKTHREFVPELTGLGRHMPVTFSAFALASAALVGVPLLPGFLSKYVLATAALEAGGVLPVLGVAALLLSAVLTAGYLFPTVINAFFPPAGHDERGLELARDPNVYMKLPFFALMAAMVILGVGSGGLISVISRVAAGLI